MADTTRDEEGASMSALGRIQDRPSRTREVFDALRVAILRGDLSPDSRYSVAELAGRFGVSRTPVREALIELASMGMVQFERNRGLRVLRSSNRDLEEIFELRRLLEVPAARLAVKRATPEDVEQLRETLTAMKQAVASGAVHEYRSKDRLFHRILLLMSGNRRLADYVETLRDLAVVRDATTVGRSESLDDSLAAHEEIFGYVAAGDGSGAGKAMERHLGHVGEMLIRRGNNET